MEKQVCPHCKKEFMPDHTPCTYCCRKCQLEGMKSKRLENENLRKELGLPENGYKSPYRNKERVTEFFKKIE